MVSSEIIFMQIIKMLKVMQRFTPHRQVICFINTCISSCPEVRWSHLARQLNPQLQATRSVQRHISAISNQHFNIRGVTTMASTMQMNGDFEKILEKKLKVAGPHQQKILIRDDKLDSGDVSEEEKELRCTLASLYRLVDFHGWTHNIYNHITARISTDDEHFLINPFGLMYYEVTASNLVKIDLEGDILEHGTTNYGCNKAGWTLHSAVHAARPDIKCIIHLHTPAGAAVSCMKCGFLRCCQESLIVGDVKYHPYSGILVDEKERKLIAENLGPTAKIMILHNHGLVVCGETIEEAYYLLVLLMAACETQVRLMSCGSLDDMILMDDEMVKQVREVAGLGGGGVSKDSDAWTFGQLEFEAAVRMLDNMGLKSGYRYKKMLNSAPEVGKGGKRKAENGETEKQKGTTKRGKK
ncbi:alpha-adducin-like [Ptychodera flava]|uniref:alpha-adducin-like n=1 Tax=Ptychodera flava TaxID=63121 RepID=UPI003969DCB6